MQALKSLLGDGNGELSTMRLVVVVVVAAVIVSKFYNAWLTKTTVTWDATDWGLLSTVIGGKLIQNTQEKPPGPTPQKE